MRSSNTNTIEARLSSWSVICTGLGIGFLVASFIGENTPTFTLWGIGMISTGFLIFLVARYLSRGKYGK